MTKRLISILLTIAVLLGTAACTAAGAGAKEDVLHGFARRETRDFPLVGAEVTVYEHVRTGAELVVIANSDTNRVFDLSFFTPAEDDTGLPHILEHAVLKGSEKYPASGPFFHLLYQTYNTFLNAETGPNYTTFPAASLSEAQLLAYADYYTDSCLHPCVLEDESIFREEAWRYRLEEESAPLTIEGTVYSEMRAAANLYQSSYNNMRRAAFPGSLSAGVSGGEPDRIPEASWEALKAYHARYYQPSPTSMERSRTPARSWRSSTATSPRTSGRSAAVRTRAGRRSAARTRPSSATRRRRAPIRRTPPISTM